MHFKLSPLIVWIDLWIVNTYSEFQVNIFSNNRDIQTVKVLHTDDNDNTKAIAVPWVFSENSQANIVVKMLNAFNLVCLTILVLFKRLDLQCRYNIELFGNWPGGF